MKLYICEKPSQAGEIAKVLGNARKLGSYWETSGGRVTWCFGHLLELDQPQDYDPKYEKWVFADLPIIPREFVFSPKRDAAAQLKAIGQLLKECTSVVIATDADREGEMIGREVLVHHRYRGAVERLWLSALDEENVRNALGKLKPGAETLPLYFAAKARSEADWLVGMNGTRGLTLKSARGSGVFSVGRVQTPTVALVVRRDREIENFKACDYYEVIAHILCANGRTIVLRHRPLESGRIRDRASAQAIVSNATGQACEFRRLTEPMRKTPPKLFSLSGLQKQANATWGWSAEKTLTIAQSLYETHKATTYPRSDCEFLPEEQLVDVPVIARNLWGLDSFKHLEGHPLVPRKSVFNTAKVTAHHAIIPTKIVPPLAAMSSDEAKAYQLIAAHYLASLLPDYEYDSTKLSTEVAGKEFAVTGTTPRKQGWKTAFGTEETDEDEDQGENPTLPDIPAGTKGKVERAEVDAKQTKPPARYTEGTLIVDMKAIAKFVTDPAKKARLNESSGIGTEATRANIIKTIKDREYVAETAGKGKKKLIVSTEKGRAMIQALEAELPDLADPGETAVWEEGLESVANRRITPEDFVASVSKRTRFYIDVLSKKADPKPPGSDGVASGVIVSGVAVLSHKGENGNYYTIPGVVKGRIFAEFFGHKLTPTEVAELVGGQSMVFKDLTGKYGPLEPAEVWFNAKKEPYPGLEFRNGFPKGKSGGSSGLGGFGSATKQESKPASGGKRRSALL